METILDGTRIGMFEPMWMIRVKRAREPATKQAPSDLDPVDPVRDAVKAKWSQHERWAFASV
jgi:hypothetical protein